MFKFALLGTVLLAVPFAVPFAVPPAFRAAAPSAPDALAPLRATQWKVDPGHSSVLFRVVHVVAPFWGRFDKLHGTVVWDAAHPEASSVELSIDAMSVNTNDGKRDDHLRGPDFFSAKEFPVLTFKSTKVVSKGEGVLEATGEFTMRGVTKTISVPIERTGEGESPFKDTRAGFEATFLIRRSDWGVKGSIPTIADEVRIVVALECVKS
ncbi:MAG: YceI family protein [Planctomycetes bacterium]|nr:YceI family protein [Planctomycetota bacterium]